MPEIKFADRPNWPRILQRRFYLAHLDESGFCGYAALICMAQALERHEITLADHAFALSEADRLLGEIAQKKFPILGLSSAHREVLLRSSLFQIS